MRKASIDTAKRDSRTNKQKDRGDEIQLLVHAIASVLLLSACSSPSRPSRKHGKGINGKRLLQASSTAGWASFVSALPRCGENRLRKAPKRGELPCVLRDKKRQLDFKARFLTRYRVHGTWYVFATLEHTGHYIQLSVAPDPEHHFSGQCSRSS